MHAIFMTGPSAVLGCPAQLGQDLQGDMVRHHISSMSHYTWYVMCYMVWCMRSRGMIYMRITYHHAYQVELAYLMGDAYTAIAFKLEDQIVASFPTAEREVTMAQVTSRLNTIRDGSMYKCASRESQSSLDAVRMTIAKMSQSIPPTDSFKTAGGLYTKIWARLPMFVRETVDDEIFTGEKALQCKFDKLEATMKHEKRHARLWELDIFKAMTSFYTV